MPVHNICIDIYIRYYKIVTHKIKIKFLSESNIFSRGFFSPKVLLDTEVCGKRYLVDVHYQIKSTCDDTINISSHYYGFFEAHTDANVTLIKLVCVKMVNSQ